MSATDRMEIMPLGSGREVGRSCVIVKYLGSTVMFDCGVHPALQGLSSLPFFDDGPDLSTVDLLLVTHFHMDHCGAVPYLTEKTKFKGRVFMTHPTKAIFKIVLHDAVKVGHDEGRLFDEKDILASMDKIELINYHQTLEHKGVRFTAYNAGHVLGCAMFMIEVAGVRVLYTGDFSREEDRHLLGAEVPMDSPHVLIAESTYGTSIHEPREQREQRFTSAIHQIVKRGGRCLIPVFALGRSQELLLILDEYWKAHPELHDVPIYYAAKVAKKAMRVYQTYINMMNEHIRSAHAAGTNPWEFAHVQNLDHGRGGAAALSNFDDSRPMVVMASPGMMQSGFSRELFEMWCSDRRNGLMMAGYSVNGTLAHHLQSEPKEITTSTGDRVPVNLSIHYISFSAHSDYAQTSHFIEQLKPKHVVLVHGAEDLMMSLQRELSKRYDPREVEFLTPGNGQPVYLSFRGPKMAKVVGALAQRPLEQGAPVSGLLVKKDFKYTLLAASDLPDATQLRATTLIQRPAFSYTGSLASLLAAVGAVFELVPLPDLGGSEATGSDGASMSAASGSTSSASVTAAAASTKTEAAPSSSRWRIHDELTLTHEPTEGLVKLAWVAGPLADMLADAVAGVLLQLQSRLLGEAAGGGGGAAAVPNVPEGPTTSDETVEQRVRTNVLRVLCEHFGEVARLATPGTGGTAGAAGLFVSEDASVEASDALSSSVCWELRACGQHVVLREAAGVWDVQSGHEEAATRVRRIVEMAQRSCTPVARSAAPAPQPPGAPP